MSIPNHVSTTEVVLLELEILLTIISIGAWGGFVSYLLRKDKTEYNSSHESIKYCLTQIVISCFTLMNPLMILVKIIKLRWIHILSYDQMV
ncbi:phage holin family protein, partial [Salmonella enterica]|nr:phage holin family protein [Salmonella enterica]